MGAEGRQRRRAGHGERRADMTEAEAIIDALWAYRARLKAKGRIIEARAVSQSLDIARREKKSHATDPGEREVVTP